MRIGLASTASMLVTTVLAALAVAPAASAAIGPVPDKTYGVNGTVYAIARTADKIYLGGDFTEIGVPSGPLAEFSSVDGAFNSAMPQVSGGQALVLAVVGDGLGGWFIGGDFTHVGGIARRNVAHILANRNVDPSWDANVSGLVQALTLSGTTLYVGGQFSGANSVNGTLTRNHLAAVDAATGTATSWNPDVNDTVWAIVRSGSTVYFAGAFAGANAVNGSLTRTHLAAVDASTGVATAWDPNANALVRTMTIVGSTLYAGGDFSMVNGATARNHAAAFDGTTGTATAWNPNFNGGVEELVVAGSSVYAGGVFFGTNSVNGSVNRNFAAAVDATTGTATAWNPAPNDYLTSIVVDGSTVYLSGWFTTMNGGAVNRSRLAAVDGTTGTATAWNPKPNSAVHTLAVSGSTVVAGGRFTFVDALARRNLVELNAADGTPTSWAPDPSGQALALAISGSTLYAGGTFSGPTAFAGVARNRLAAVDLTTHAVLPWNPNASGAVSTLEVSGSTVYIGGFFSGPNSINGALTRNRIAAVDAVTGDATPWNPNLNGTVSTIEVAGSTIYVGGAFAGTNSVNGVLTRNHIAAIDAGTGTATAWDPNVGGNVNDIDVAGPTVYVGGQFDTVNGSVTRNNVAAFDASNGAATGWDPNASGAVTSLLPAGSIFYIAGSFAGANSLNGSVQRDRLAAVDATTGAATGWAPQANITVRTLVADGFGGLLTGGSFTSFDLVPVTGFAAFSEPPASASAPQLTGVADIGSTVTCSPGTWSGTQPQSYDYQWLRDGSAIAGATAASYQIDMGDGGHALSCRVAASNLAGSANATSAALAVAAPTAPTDQNSGGSTPGGGASEQPGSTSETSTTTTTATTTPTASVTHSGGPSIKAQGSSFTLGTGLLAGCPAGGSRCSVTVVASSLVPASLASRTRRIVVGQATFTLAAGAKRRLSVKLNLRGARALRKLRRMQIRLAIATKVGPGPSTRTTRTIAIKLPRKR